MSIYFEAQAFSNKHLSNTPCQNQKNDQRFPIILLVSSFLTPFGSQFYSFQARHLKLSSIYDLLLEVAITEIVTSWNWPLQPCENQT